MIPTEQIPTDYREGYEKARPVDEAVADNYIAHTLIGDPVVDALLDEIASLEPDQVHRFINAGMEEDEATLKEGPQALREFFFTAPQPDPDWLDYDAFRPGIRTFQRNASNILPAFVAGTLLVGFSTLISKSFVQTGRIFDDGVRRLRQNNRHMLEIFFPQGLERQSDGWKLSVRIRFVHGQIRRLLAAEAEYDQEAWGVPISAAHLGFAIANFAGSTIEFASRLGAKFTEEERTGFYAVWRYSGYLMGIPETILFTDEKSATELRRVALLCEPPPTLEAILMTNALINSAPLVAGVEDQLERANMVDGLIYPVSRALIGSRLASQLRFPESHLPNILFWYKVDQWQKRLRMKLSKNTEPTFATLLLVSAYDDAGISYRLPTDVYAERSNSW